MDRVIGIDLGTTNSCVCTVEAGVPKVVPNKGGYKTTPSIVAISESGRRLVGQMAKRQAITNAKHTVHASKRLIGRPWGAPAVKHCIETCPYEIVEGPHQDVRIRLRDRDYSLPEISSIILQEMKLIAEDYFGEEVDKAVVTVPAYFSDAQRQATLDAGRIAGLDILRIINEPTAAALAYGYGKQLETTVAIYDLGGGTFDISVLEIGDGVFEVLATAGDTFLGGEDFDARIIEHLAYNFARDHRVDLRRDEMSLQRLRDAAEKAKIELTTMKKTEISLPFIHTNSEGEALHLQIELTRETFEELVADLVQRANKICEATLQNAGLETADVDDVILVGGMTRMPRIQEAVGAFFGKPASKSVHPDEAVAVGAAIQASGLVGGQDEVLLLDVTPHSLGIMVHGGGFEKLIEANSAIPTGASHTFTTIRENQPSVKIVVFQGENPRAQENEFLGEFVLHGLRPAPAGAVEISVSFDISADGIVSVSAKDQETGKEQSIQVTATTGLTEEEIRAMIHENEDYLLQLHEGEDLEKSRSDVRQTIRQFEEVIDAAKESQSPIMVEASCKALEAVVSARAALEGEGLETIISTGAALSRALNAFREVWAQYDES
jgi:molecular chaperone DnaK